MTERGSQGMQLESSSSRDEPTVEKYCSDGDGVCVILIYYAHSVLWKKRERREERRKRGREGGREGEIEKASEREHTCSS
jgi:hypothetical protein